MPQNEIKKITKKYLSSSFLLAPLLLFSIFSCTRDWNNPTDANGSIDPADWGPQNFTAQTVNTDQIKLNWDYESDVDIDGFILWRQKTGDSSPSELEEVSKFIRTYTDVNAGVNITYDYKIVSNIEETLSDEKTLRYTAGFTINAPSNLQTSKLSDTSLQLTWTDNSNNESGFEIERKTGTSNWVTLTTKNANVISHTDVGLTIDETYSYRVKATHSYGDSDWSEEVTETISSGPDDGFVEIAGGTFQMGSTTYSDEQPIHSVTVSDFWMSAYEVSQSEVLALLGDQGWSDSYGKGDNHPAYNVTWYEAVEYCNLLSVEAGLVPAYEINGTDVTCDFSKNGYRLPTEAEWEYAAGGGSSNRTTYAGTDSESSLGDVAWYYDNSYSLGSSHADYGTHAGGEKQANSLGLYDMSGNVWEWCWDWYGSSYYSSSPSSDPAGPSSGSYRVRRGGSWDYGTTYCRGAFRYFYAPSNSYDNVGFRLVRSGA